LERLVAIVHHLSNRNPFNNIPCDLFLSLVIEPHRSGPARVQNNTIRRNPATRSAIFAQR
jgi:hypothetical protein